MFIISASAGQEYGSGLARASDLASLLRLQSRCWLGLKSHFRAELGKNPLPSLHGRWLDSIPCGFRIGIRQQGKESLSQTGVTVLCNVIMEVAFYYPCWILLVQSKPQVLYPPWRKGDRSNFARSSFANDFVSYLSSSPTSFIYFILLHLLKIFSFTLQICTVYW